KSCAQTPSLRSFPTRRSSDLLLLFDLPATLVLVTMAAVSFAGVPLTRRALDVLVVLGLIVVGRIVAGGALLLAALPDLGRPLARSEEHTSELQSRFDLVCRLL